jgi:chromosome segregation ATPase
MAEDKGSALTAVLIAVIGLIGSLGGAWITTGSKFESELRDNQASVKSLQNEIGSLKGQLSGKIDEANRQLVEMRQLLGSAQKENEALQARINDLKSHIDTANKTVEQAKEVNKTLTENIRLKGLDQRMVKPK